MPTFRLSIQQYLGYKINGKWNPKPLSSARGLTLHAENMDIDQVKLLIAKKLGILPNKFQKDSSLYILKKNSRRATHCFGPGCSQTISGKTPYTRGELYYEVQPPGKDYFIPTCLGCVKKEIDAVEGDLRIKGNYKVTQIQARQ